MAFNFIINPGSWGSQRSLKQGSKSAYFVKLLNRKVSRRRSPLESIALKGISFSPFPSAFDWYEFPIRSPALGLHCWFSGILCATLIYCKHPQINRQAKQFPMEWRIGGNIPFFLKRDPVEMVELLIPIKEEQGYYSMSITGAGSPFLVTLSRGP